ncbi:MULTISPECIES: type I restriction endonuclease subunit R [unclassified Thalassospira]|uniref:type I restriction endonuclease subunit R n=1 Tax=unclassified Thalassospira TaxID=2648997 RepID=UPI000ECFC53F|nr:MULTISPECIES: type I restriction endonuclease subunit R [unclassified Thalassospira]HAI29878.1 DEAD/DEAH box helicase [Thalassospira sp.]|tara:strand:- start:15570 stop:18713 length:3144 start_codon:yes stop_codon:yes gene_type:complete
MAYLSEAEVEAILLEHFMALGYARLSDGTAGPDGNAPERAAYSDVLLQDRLKQAIDRLNPDIPDDARHDALTKIIAVEMPSLVAENRRLHRAMVEGVPVEYYDTDGTIRGDKVRLIDFEDPDANDWLVMDQFTVIENGYNRRPDVVVFINGMPVGVIELKNPGTETADLTSAFNQLQTYKTQISSLFRTNAVLVTSDGVMARIGSLTANEERFMPWRTTDGRSVAAKGSPEMSVLIEGVFEKRRFLDLIRDFTVFSETDDGIAKIIAGYHQYHAVLHALESTVSATAQDGDRKAGVIWHTQGSGKSLLMAFYAGLLVRRSDIMENPTIVVITDRNDLDEQLFGTFAKCRDLIRQTPVRVESRDDLQRQLIRASGGVIFTTIQKFSPPDGEREYPVLTDRRNVIVIADEAHRSQYGFKARVAQKTGDIAYGFAKYMRDALPNASFIGFTGTPIEKVDVNTPAIFGDYIDIYDISRAVEDGATVPIYYESRLARIDIPEDEKPIIDAEIEDLTEYDEEPVQERLKQKWSKVEALVGAEKRIAMLADDMIDHFESRVASMDGKAMIVAMSRRICVALYDAIIARRPDWHSDDDMEGVIKVVMTGSASDPENWQPHIGNKKRRDTLAARAKDPKDPLKLVIVRDMWLTGFDAPSMHTMYIDKPMRGHGLMQAIARVNRVFADKPAGLIVDYIGIAQNLKNALGQYSPEDRDKTGIDEAEAVAVMQEKYDVVCAMFDGFDYKRGITGTGQERLAVMAGAIEWVLDFQQKEAAAKKTELEKKRAHRRYQDAVLALSKAFALAGASDEARAIRDEVGFFQAVRIALVKSNDKSGMSAAEKQFAVQQLIDRSVVSTEIVDILGAAGLESPDISILSDDFLAEIKEMEKKNLALEALKKLLNDEIRSRSQSNVTESKKFSERLEQAMMRYHMNAISTVEVLQELIEIARDIREARNRGEEQGLSEEEVAFYDALAENASAVEVMGNDALKVIAHELLTGLKNSVSVDWQHRDSARAKMRVLVKRTLRKYGFPPDLQDQAVQTVLKQAEALSMRWSA